MCTAIALRGTGTLFGRTLDVVASFGERVTVTPRNFKFNFLYEKSSVPHYAIIGMAHVLENTPLYYEAVNEFGLAAAALNFPGLSKYFPKESGKRNIASFELIPMALSFCKSISEVKDFFKDANITDGKISNELPPTPLHFMLCDREKSITVEQTDRGLEIYDNPFDVLTNSPDFSYHKFHLSDFSALTPYPSSNALGLSDIPYSRGLGAFGLPGDFSSSSRFIRAFFLKSNTPCEENTEESVNSFFHIMDSVSVPKGSVRSKDGEYFYTFYTSCMDLENKEYYLSSYSKREIRRHSLYSRDLDGGELFYFS